MDDKETISALRIDLNECVHSPAKELEQYKPTNAIERAWIPQTIADQVWALWKFDTVDARLAWEASLPPEIARWLDRSLIVIARPYGWQIHQP